MKEEILSAYGENVAKMISMAIKECYEQLDGNALLPVNEAQIRGKLQAYRHSLQTMGKDYEVEIKIVGDGA